MNGISQKYSKFDENFESDDDGGMDFEMRNQINSIGSLSNEGFEFSDIKTPSLQD